MVKNILGKALAIVLLSGVCYADDYSDAFIAYDKKDYKKAFNLYNKCCDSGDSRGCVIVGSFYEDDVVVNRNFYKASEYYDKACGMGNNYACTDALPKSKEKIPVCTESEISFINDKRYFEFAYSQVAYPITLADSKTIQIDKKSKTIKVWTVWIVSSSKREEYINALGGNYNNFGYVKNLETINYGSMKAKINSTIDYNCNGSSIYSNKNSEEWSDIIPGSVMEGITQTIMKKYNLK